MQDFAPCKVPVFVGTEPKLFAHPGKLKKLLLVMKITAILLLAATLQVSATGWSQEKISLSFSNAPLEQVLNSIAAQTEVSFFYRPQYVKGKTVTINITNGSLKAALDMCLKNQQLAYEIVGKTVAIHPVKKGKSISGLEVIENAPPLINVRGRVVNENEEPVMAASVSVKSTSQGTTTNDNGEFYLLGLEENAVLVISGVNITTIEIKVNGLSNLAINVKSSVTPLEETIIKGYYTTTKRLNTGSVSKVTSETISNQPVSNPLAAITGRMPGVIINQQSGIPGGGFSVQIRGQNSLRNTLLNNGNLPLYIIDGVPFTSTLPASTATSFIIQYGNPLSYINPSDIESIEVLKDADATSIYGARGANGVVLITTKKGKIGKTKIDANVYTSFGKVTRMMDLLNTQQYLEMRREAFNNDGTIPTRGNARDLFRWDTTRYTDWQKALIGETARTTNGNLSISGGDRNTQFLIGAGYRKEGSVFPGDFSDQKTSLNLNLNHKSENGKFLSNISVIYVSDKNNLLQSDLTSTALTLSPNAPALYDSAGNLNWENSSWLNPLSSTLKKYDLHTDNLISNAMLSYQIISGLNAKVNLGYTNLQLKEITTTPLRSFDPAVIAFVTGSTVFANSYIKSWIAEPQLEYKKKIGPGLFSFLAGTTFQQSIQEGETLQASGYTNDALIENVKAAPSITILDANYRKYRYNAIFLRAYYDFKQKYLLNLTARRDGSSRFGKEKQFANFGSVGASWIFSNENFMKNVSFLSFGKIRGSFGTTGSDQIGDYEYLDSYSSTTYVYNGNVGLIPTRLTNPEYSWETNNKLEAALELGFLKDHILFSASWYRNYSSNQLVGYPLPVITGQSIIQYNLPAEVKNSGLEFELSSTNVNNKNFTWKSSVNITFPRNTLLSYPNIEGSPYANIYTVGKSLFSRKLFHFEGVDPTTGLYMFTDFDKDGQISYPNDLQSTKEISQKFYGGFLNTVDFKGLQLDVFFQFIKQAGWNYLYTGTLPGSMSNQPTEVLNRWQKNGDITDVQKLTRNFGSAAATSYFNVIQSDYTISDASFIRLKNLSLSYQLPLKWSQKYKSSLTRVYVQTQNLITITNYLGMDPEQPFVQNLPPLKTVAFGIQLTF
jgi:TonB-linked SusC/RagA family outer membrane protein